MKSSSLSIYHTIIALTNSIASSTYRNNSYECNTCIATHDAGDDAATTCSSASPAVAKMYDVLLNYTFRLYSVETLTARTSLSMMNDDDNTSNYASLVEDEIMSNENHDEDDDIGKSLIELDRYLYALAMYPSLNSRLDILLQLRQSLIHYYTKNRQMPISSSPIQAIPSIIIVLVKLAESSQQSYYNNSKHSFFPIPQGQADILTDEISIPSSFSRNYQTNDYMGLSKVLEQSHLMPPLFSDFLFKYPSFDTVGRTEDNTNHTETRDEFEDLPDEASVFRRQWLKNIHIPDTFSSPKLLVLQSLLSTVPSIPPISSTLPSNSPSYLMNSVRWEESNNCFVSPILNCRPSTLERLELSNSLTKASFQHLFTPEYPSHDESFVVRCCLFALQGFSSELLPFNPHTLTFSRISLGTRDMRSNCTSSILDPICHCASQLAIIYHNHQTMLTSNIAIPQSDINEAVSTLQHASVCQSYFQSILKLIQLIRASFMLTNQHAISRRRCDQNQISTDQPSDTTVSLTLFELYAHSRALFQQVDYLFIFSTQIHVLWNSNTPDSFYPESRPSNPATLTTNPTTILLSQLYHYCSISTSNPKLHSMVQTCFLNSIQPFLRILSNWIYLGELDDPYHELFASDDAILLCDDGKNKDASTTNSLSDLIFHCSDNNINPFLPTFLHPVKSEILEIGLYLRMLLRCSEDYYSILILPQTLFQLSVITSPTEAQFALQRRYHLKEKQLDLIKCLKNSHTFADSSNTFGSLNDGLPLGIEALKTAFATDSVPENHQLATNPDSQVEYELPLPIAIEMNLLDAVHCQYSIVCQGALSCIMHNLELRKELHAIRQYLLLGAGDVMNAFLHSLFTRLHSTPPVLITSPAVLRAELNDYFKLYGYEKDPRSALVYFKSVELSPQCQQQLLYTFNQELCYNVRWPLNYVLSASSMMSYSTISSFLVRLQFVKFELHQLFLFIRQQSNIIDAFESKRIPIKSTKHNRKKRQHIRQTSADDTFISSFSAGSRSPPISNNYTSTNTRRTKTHWRHSPIKFASPSASPVKQPLNESMDDSFISTSRFHLGNNESINSYYPTAKHRLRWLAIQRAKMYQFIYSLLVYFTRDVITSINQRMDSSFDKCTILVELREVHDICINAMLNAFMHSNKLSNLFDNLFEDILLFISESAMQSWQMEIPLHSWHDLQSSAFQIHSTSSFIVALAEKEGALPSSFSSSLNYNNYYNE